jgi:hypothetical protein
VQQQSVDITAIARDAAWLPHRYEEGKDNILFVRLEREGHRAATFLTEEYIGADLPRRVVRRADAASAASPPAPIHFIFHSAFCCSTLLARAADYDGVSMGLKEPVILNDMVGWKRRGADPRMLAPVLDNVLKLLAQPFGPGESLVVKPSNILNSLAPGILHLRPQANALLLYAPLDVYLRSVAKKGMWCRLWVRELLLGQLKDGIVNLGFETKDYLAQTDLQVAAVGWLAQHVLFAGMVERYGPGRVRTLDSVTLLDRSEEVLARFSDLFRLGFSEEDIAKILAGPAFNTHSKFGTGFTPEDRAAEHRDAAAVHAEEIEKVTVWAEKVAEAAGISLTLKAPLVSS